MPRHSFALKEIITTNIHSPRRPKKKKHEHGKQHATKQKCIRCGKCFKRLDSHLLRNSCCKIAGHMLNSSSEACIEATVPPESLTASVISQESLTTSATSLAPQPHVRERLLLPKSRVDWDKADEFSATELVQVVMNEKDIETTWEEKHTIPLENT